VIEYIVTYIDEDRMFAGPRKITIFANTEFQAINKLIQDSHKNVWEIIKVEKKPKDSS
tara:strand:+ start:344 stop:517 length:174 start_codon:yes stop_codon:yes gene_type:complete